jgi:hypothetical protein
MVAFALAAALVPACTDADAATAPVAAAPASNPLTGLTRTDPVPLSGVVEERLVAGSYVYLALRGADGERRWVVLMGAAPPLGASAQVVSMGRRADFRSARLGREFAELHFAVAPTAH